VTPPNAAAAGLSVTPPPPIIGSRRVAVADHKNPASRRRQNSVGLGLYLLNVVVDGVKGNREIKKAKT